MFSPPFFKVFFFNCKYSNIFLRLQEDQSMLVVKLSLLLLSPAANTIDQPGRVRSRPSPPPPLPTAHPSIPPKPSSWPGTAVRAKIWAGPAAPAAADTAVLLPDGSGGGVRRRYKTSSGPFQAKDAFPIFFFFFIPSPSHTHQPSLPPRLLRPPRKKTSPFFRCPWFFSARNELFCGRSGCKEEVLIWSRFPQPLYNDLSLSPIFPLPQLLYLSLSLLLTHIFPSRNIQGRTSKTRLLKQQRVSSFFFRREVIFTDLFLSAAAVRTFGRTPPLPLMRL